MDRRFPTRRTTESNNTTTTTTIITRRVDDEFTSFVVVEVVERGENTPRYVGTRVERGPVLRVGPSDEFPPNSAERRRQEANENGVHESKQSNDREL